MAREAGLGIRAALRLFLAGLAAGCGSQSGVQVTVTSGNPVPGVSFLRATVTNGGMTAAPIRFSPAGAPVEIGPAMPQRFTLLFDPGRTGDVGVAVEALAGETVLGRGAGSVAIAPGKLASLTISLGGQPNPDMGADGAPPDAGPPDLSMKRVSFAPAVSYPTTVQPLSVAAADFDGDGNLDLINTSYQNLNVTPFRGNGDGTFARLASVSTGSLQPRAVVAGDFDGLGGTDIAVAYYAVQPGAKNVGVFTGDGRFGFVGVGSWPTAAGPSALAAGDINKDGLLDAVVTCGDASSVVVLLNQGAGMMMPRPGVAAGTGPRGVAIGDLNGDLAPDLAIAVDASGEVTVLLGDGAGGFSGSKSYPTGPHCSGVAIGDLDGDGRPDIAAASQGDQQSPGAITVLLNAGDDFRAAGDHAVGTQPSDLALADFDGDTQLDVAVVNAASGNVSVCSTRAAARSRRRRRSPAAPGRRAWPRATSTWTAEWTLRSRRGARPRSACCSTPPSSPHSRYPRAWSRNRCA